MSGVDQVAAAIWEAPAALAARRGHPMLGRVLADGEWLRVWPPLAIVAPLVGLGCGWYAATSRSIYEQVFTASIGLVVLLAVVAAAGALVGLFVTIAYAIGDLVIYDHTFDAAILHPDGLGRIAYVIVPLLTTYVLLGLLTVNIPLVATTVRRGVQHRGGTVAGVAAGSVATFALTWSWVAAAPHVLRSTYSYQSVWDAPVHGPTGIFTPILEHGWTVVWAATAAMAIRLVAEAIIERTRPALEPPAPAETRRGPARVALSVVLGAAFAFALVGAVSQTKGQFMLLAGVCVGTALLRSAVLPLVSSYQRLADRVPLVVRAAVAVVGTYLLTQLLAGDAASPATNPSNSNAALVLTIAIAAPMIALLFPATARLEVAR